MEKIMEKMKEKAVRWFHENKDEYLRDITLDSLRIGIIYQCEALYELDPDKYHYYGLEDPEIQEKVPQSLIGELKHHIKKMVIPVDDRIKAENSTELEYEYAERILEEIDIAENLLSDENQYQTFEHVFGAKEIYSDWYEDEKQYIGVSILKIYYINRFFIVVDGIGGVERFYNHKLEKLETGD